MKINIWFKNIGWKKVAERKSLGLVLLLTFETAHNPECKVESYGIGLAIVKQLVEENGGKIWVESVLGKETKFHFTIPKN